MDGIQPKNSTFISSVKYYDENNKENYVKVNVEICYISKTFNITNSKNNKQFMFHSNSCEFNKWLAVNEAIKNGIQYAVDILELKNIGK